MNDDTLFGSPDFLSVLEDVKEIRNVIDQEFDQSNVIPVDFEKRKKGESEER